MAGSFSSTPYLTEVRVQTRLSHLNFPSQRKSSVCLSVSLSVCLCSLFEETYHGNVKHDAELVPKQF